MDDIWSYILIGNREKDMQLGQYLSSEWYMYRNVGMWPYPHRSLWIIPLMYTQPVIFQGVISIEGHGSRQWGMQQEKVWQLITEEPSCDCGWLCVCVTLMHEQHSPWFINVMVLTFTCTPTQFLSPFSCSPKCRVPTGDIQPPWEQEVSCRGELSISRALCNMEFHLSFHHILLKTMHLLCIFTWRTS